MMSQWLTKEQKALHSNAWRIIELIEQFIVNPKFNYLKTTEIPLSSKDEKDEMQKYNHPIDYLIDKNIDKAQSLIIKHILHGLIIDFCYFMQEALSCAKRGRIVVAFSLLRRPLVFNLIILLRIYADEKFIDKFMNEESYDPTCYCPEEIKNMLSKIDDSRIITSISSEVIYEFIFDKMNPQSIINLSNRAIHPTTTRKQNQTGVMNFNFIFADKEIIKNLISLFYSSLIPVLMYYFEVLNILIIQFIPEEELQNTLNKQYKDLLSCLS